MILTATVLLLLAGLAWVAAQCATGGWRRILLRSEWATIMRSCGLAQRRDREVRHKPGAGEKTSPMNQVEHLPRLWALFGRPIGPLNQRVGATYRCWAAKGQTTSEIAAKAELIASSLHSQRVIVDILSPRSCRITVLWRDPFTIPQPWAPATPGRTSPCYEVTGRRLQLPLMDDHGGSWLVGGAAGGGKSSWVRALVADYVRQPAGTCHLYGIDIKRLELGAWEPAFHEVARDRGHALRILKAARQFITTRTADLEAVGLDRVPDTPTLEWPYLVLVIEELSALLSGSGPLIDDLKLLLCEIVELGRAPGVVVIAASQKPTSDVIPSRFTANVSRRVLLRASSITHGQAVLGWTPTQADIDQLTTNGLALLEVPGHRTRLARATWGDIAEVRALAAHYAIHHEGAHAA